MNSTTLSAAHALATRLDNIEVLYHQLPAGDERKVRLLLQFHQTKRRFFRYVHEGVLAS